MRFMTQAEPTNHPSPASPAVPNPETLLRAIAQQGEEPWFPSTYAATTGIARDALDGPLTDLRLAGLIEVVTWVKGRGQGYRLTTAGEQALRGQPVSPPATSSAPSLDNLPLNPRPLLVVWLLTAACLVVFLTGLILAAWEGLPLRDYLNGQDVMTVHRLGAVRGWDLLDGQWYRLLTANFAHFGWLHVLANLVALVLLGAEVETIYGRWQLAWLFLLSGMGGVAVAVALTPTVVLAGASAAIWGLLAALAVWLLTYRQYLPPLLFQRALFRLSGIVLLNLLLSLTPGISWAGHLGGAVWGVLGATGLLAERHSHHLWTRWLLRGGIGVLTLLPAVGLYLVSCWSADWTEMRERYHLEQQRRRLWEAQQQFNHEVVPRLNRISPSKLEALERTAVLQLLRPATRRDSATMAHLREQIQQCLQDAEQILALLDGPPTGHAAFDRYRQQVQQYTTTVQHALHLLTLMLDDPNIPSETAWNHWGQTRRQLETLWFSLQPP
jgi:membrane associated rhomboid family serine protease